MRMHRVFAAALAAATVLTGTNGGAAAAVASANPAWTDQFDAAGGFDRVSAVAVGSGRAFGGGIVTNAAGNTDLFLRAYDLQTGAQLWQDQYDRGGGNDSLVGIAAFGTRVFAAGASTDGMGNGRFLVRAYDAATGALAWEDQSFRGLAFGVAARMGRVMVGGFATLPGGKWATVVRAYDTATGKLLWENRILDSGVAVSLAIQNDTLYTAGGSNYDAALQGHLCTRAYDVRNGALLWESELPLSGALDQGWMVVPRGTRVFTAGSSSHTQGSCTDDFINGNCDFVVRAHDAATGALLWEDVLDKAGQRDGAYALAVRRGKVYAAGLGSNGSFTRNFLVRAYDETTGALIWEDDQTDRGGGAFAIAAVRDKVYATGDGS